eukprot:2529819-Prymnesium_polylepis.1
MHDGIQRRFAVVTPPNKGFGNAITSLVIGIHGWTQNAEISCQKMAQSFVTTHDFVAVCPQGLLNSVGQSGWATHSGEVGGDWIADDIGFIRAARDWAIARFNVSSNTTFAIGFSFGGDVVLRLMCEASDIFSGFAVVGHA